VDVATVGIVPQERISSTTNPNSLRIALRVGGTLSSWFDATSSSQEIMTMAKTVETRLVTLERRIPLGCPTCRFWVDTVLGDDDGSRSRPDACPECGRYVPIRTVIVIQGVPWSAL